MQTSKLVDVVVVVYDVVVVSVLAAVVVNYVVVANKVGVVFVDRHVLLSPYLPILGKFNSVVYII